MLPQNFLEDPSQLAAHRLPGRAALIPAQKKGVYYENKFESDFLQDLNGEYRFYYSPRNDFEDFYAEDMDDSAWARQTVPSMWEFDGYGKPCYPNTEYPFPFDPPYVDCDNPIGCYRRHFHLAHRAARSVLHFDGVDNCFEVYVNGQFAGCAKNARISCEFDVTSLLREGDNLLAVKVYKYSDASYLENQDMLLTSGLFRDVYLIHTPAETLWDATLQTDMHQLDCRLSFAAEGCYAGYTVEAELDGETQQSAIQNNQAHFTFTPKQVRLWNAETPELYDLTITLKKNGQPKEIHSKRVGFRTVRYENGLLLVNETPITLKGVNRHEYNCKTGRTIQTQQIRAELEELKRCHVNAIRCSHYPNHPAFYEIASELGLYVADEADLESHGCGVTGDQGFLSKSPHWFNAYFDRVGRMVARDKNEACIIIWSVGNECGSGENLDRCCAWLHQLPDVKPVLQAQDGQAHICDFRQAGYCKIQVLKDFTADDPHPAVMTEYAHAMGNSPGALYDYWNEIYHTPYIAGGFVWEFKNHGFYRRNPNGSEDYLYGGDFGDINHFSNFTLDGYHFSDGTPKPAAEELREALAPAWAELRDGDVYIMNTNDFRNLDEWTLEWRVLEDMTLIRHGERPMDHVPPHEWICFRDYLPVNAQTPGAEYRLEILLKKDGRVDAAKQLRLPVRVQPQAFVPQPFTYRVTQKGDCVRVTGNDFALHIENGMIARYEKNGDIRIDRPMQVQLFRAPTDNDGIVGRYPRRITDWNGALLDQMRYHCETTRVEQLADRVRVSTSGKVLPLAKFVGFISEIDYEIYSGGKVLVRWHGVPYGKMPECLPRIGMMFTLRKSYQSAVWYGRGVAESYIDRCLSTPMGRYACSIEKMNTLYEVPQETGNHYETRFVCVQEQNGPGFSVVGCPNFEFSFHPFDLQTLTRARHRSELTESNVNYLYIDYKMRGLGSYSCGPEPEEPYELHPHEFNFAFLLLPESSETEALAYARKAYDTQTAALSGTYTPQEQKKIRQLFDCAE